MSSTLDLENDISHDGIWESIDIEYCSRKVTVVCDVYIDPDDARRKIVIEFTGISSVSHSADVNRMEDNMYAGTICSWKFFVERKMAQFYLVDGFLQVNYDKASIRTII